MLSVWFPMFLFALTGAISPGPVNLIAASIGASAGFVRALPHVAGASLSYAAIVWLMGTSLQRVLVAQPQVAHALQWAGAAYLLYLAWRIATARPTAGAAPASGGPDGTDDPAGPVEPPTASGLLQGGLTQSLNPKAWLVALSGVSLFVTAGPDARMLLLGFCLISGVVCFASVAAWAALGQLVGKWLTQARYQLVFNRTMAALLAMVVFTMLFPAES